MEKRDLSVGTLCLALYAEDELFYRARVLAINDGNSVTVVVGQGGFLPVTVVCWILFTY